MITVKDFRDLFKEVIHPEDDTVLIYSGLWTFGHRFKEEPSAVPDLVLDAVLEALSESRDLLLPAYTYLYAKTRVFDVRSSKPETGILPETLLKRSTAKRRRSALSSFLVQGPRAQELSQLKGESIWGSGSLVEWIHKHNVRIVTLGLPWLLSCGFFHRIEELAQVPYRFYKDFPGAFVDENGKSSPWSECMYVRSLDVPSRFVWKRVSDQIERMPSFLKSKSPGIQIESAKANDIVNAGLKLIRDDPYALLSNQDEVKAWVAKGGKEEEISRMRVNERKAS